MEPGTAYFPDLVADQRVIADVACSACGYNLRGLDITHPCPECSADVCRSVEAAARTVIIAHPLNPRWRLPCIVLACVGLLILAGFYLALWMNDLELHDLRPVPGRPAHDATASSLSTAPSILSNALLPVSILGGLYCLGVTAVAIARHDRKTLIVAGSRGRGRCPVHPSRNTNRFYSRRSLTRRESR